MKQTLRDKIEQMLKDISERIIILDRHIKEYVEDGKLSDAAINQIKRDTFEIIRVRLIESLN